MSNRNHTRAHGAEGRAILQALVAGQTDPRVLAILAVVHSILTISYHLLTRHTTYQDLGKNYFDERDREGVKLRAVRRLEQLGFQVTLSPPMPTFT